MNFDGILGNLFNIIKQNPQLINNILSLFSNTKQNQEQKENIDVPKTPENLTDNSYWSLPQYNFTTQNSRKKSRYKDIQTTQMYSQNSVINNSDAIPINNNEYNQHTTEQKEENKLDINAVFKLLGEILPLLKNSSPKFHTQNKTKNESDVPTTNSILALRPTK